MAFKHTACFVFTVMIVCNAVLYPSIFSTIFRGLWSGGENGDIDNNIPKEKREVEPDMPPHMRQRGPGPATAGRTRSEHLNPRRAARGESGNPSFFGGGKGGGGDAKGGRGLMGSILPVYAVGILMYFAYIMYKIFLKDKKPEDGSKPKASASFNEFQSQYGPTLERQKAEELQKSLSEELRGTKKQVTATIKKAKAKALDDDGKEVDVKALQKRLEDTEKSMQRMMDMMSNMGVAMNQVTKQLCTGRSGGEDDDDEDIDHDLPADDEDIDHDLPADDEISDGDDPLAGHSSQDEEDIDNELGDKIPPTSKDNYVSMKDAPYDNTIENNTEDNVVEDIGVEENGGDDDTVRRRHVGSAGDGQVESVQ